MFFVSVKSTHSLQLTDHNVFLLILIHSLKSYPFIYFYGIVGFLHRQRHPFKTLLFQQRQHFPHHLCANAFPTVLLIQGNRKGWRVIIHMTVVVHDPCPHSAHHFSIAVSHQAMIPFSGTEIIYVYSQLRLVEDTPRWRSYTLRNKNRFIQKIF